LSDLGPKPECTKHDPEIWVYGERYGQTNLAKYICRKCPLYYSCQDRAILNPDPHMILGGLTPREQQAARKHHQRKGTIHTLTDWRTA
jgi:hypothetical protein